MKNYLKYLGLAFLVLGVLLLIVGHFLSWTSHNLFLCLILVFILAGVVIHVCLMKKNDKY